MAAKRCIESTIAGLSLIALSPLLAIVAAVLWFESKGPIFYGDTREGLDGRVFRCCLNDVEVTNEGLIVDLADANAEGAQLQGRFDIVLGKTVLSRESG